MVSQVTSAAVSAHVVVSPWTVMAAMARRPPFSARPPSLRRKKPLMLPQPESSSRSCRRGNYQPGRGRGLAGGFTSSLGDLGSAETPRQRQPPPS